MIAVLLDENEKLTDFFGIKKIFIYKKKKKFKVVNKIDNIRINATGMDKFKDGLKELEKYFNGTIVILGKQITGIPFYYFDKMGFKLCEAEELTMEVLEIIYEDYCEISVYEIQDEKRNPEIAEVPVRPVETDEKGNYYFDFLKLQKYKPEISSKRALIPFFYNDNFDSLTIICSHIMPWLDLFMKERGLESKVIRGDGKYMVIVSHRK